MRNRLSPKLNRAIRKIILQRFFPWTECPGWTVYGGHNPRKPGDKRSWVTFPVQYEIDEVDNDYYIRNSL